MIVASTLLRTSSLTRCPTSMLSHHQSTTRRSTSSPPKRLQLSSSCLLVLILRTKCRNLLSLMDLVWANSSSWLWVKVWETKLKNSSNQEQSVAGGLCCKIAICLHLGLQPSIPQLNNLQSLIRASDCGSQLTQLILLHQLDSLLVSFRNH